MLGKGKVEVNGKVYGEQEPVHDSNHQTTDRNIDDPVQETERTSIRDRWYQFSWVKDDDAYTRLKEKAANTFNTYFPWFSGALDGAQEAQAKPNPSVQDAEESNTEIHEPQDNPTITEGDCINYGIITEYELPPLPESEVQNIQDRISSTSIKKAAKSTIAYMDALSAWAERNPNLAEYGLPAVAVGTQTVVGGVVGTAAGGPVGTVLGSIAGAFKGLVSELSGTLIGHAVAAEAAPYTQASLIAAGVKLRSSHPELTQEESEALSLAAALGIGGITLGSIGLKQGLKAWKEIKHQKTHLFDGFDRHGMYHGDIRIDHHTSLHAKEFFESIRIEERFPAEVMNAKIKNRFPEPPFKPGTKVAVFEADGQTEFIRAYTIDPTKAYAPTGQWIALKKDVEGLTPTQIKNKFDLPNTPTHITTVTPPKGIKLAVGITNEGNFGGKGQGTQFYFIEKAFDDWFGIGEKLK